MSIQAAKLSPQTQQACIDVAITTNDYLSTVLLYTGAQIVTPERAFAVNNGSVTLSCPADSTSWLRYNGNDLVPVTEGNGVVLRGAELIIEGFHSLTHAGSYYCIATNNNMSTVSCPAEIIHSRK